MTSRVSIAGVSMTRFGKFLNKSVKDLVQESVSDALIDAGLSKDDVEAIFFWKLRSRSFGGTRYDQRSGSS